MVRVQFPGYFTETMRSGNIRHRVRVEGYKKTKITLPFGPDDPRFHQAYAAARAGIKTDNTPASVAPQTGTVGFLVNAYMAHLQRQIAAGEASPLTLNQRKGFGDRLMLQRSRSGLSMGKLYRDLPAQISDRELIALKDEMAGTPGARKNFFKFLNALFDFGVERGLCQINPARAIKVPYSSKGGAVPWTTDDLNAYRKTHPPGTMAHLTLTLFMFTACRIGDAVLLGRKDEVARDGLRWLAWQPAKKGSSPVEVPILPPLAEAIRAQRLAGETYLLTEKGQPFASPEALRNKLRKWCEKAGIENRTSHGIRKAAGHLLALHGATQYEIMSIHGHANASTSQVYTQGVERTRLAASAARKLGAMRW